MEQASEVGRGKSSMPGSMAVSTPPTITCPEIVFLTGIRFSSVEKSNLLVPVQFLWLLVNPEADIFPRHMLQLMLDR